MRSSTCIQGSGLVRSVGLCAQIASVHLGDVSVATSAGPLLHSQPGRLAFLVYIYELLQIRFSFMFCRTIGVLFFRLASCTDTSSITR